MARHISFCKLLDRVATAHATPDGELVGIDDVTVDDCAPAAAMHSCAEDLSHRVRL